MIKNVGLQSCVAQEDTTAPVSYTHLDVYKRQCTECGSVCRACILTRVVQRRNGSSRPQMTQRSFVNELSFFR